MRKAFASNKRGIEHCCCGVSSFRFSIPPLSFPAGGLDYENAANFLKDQFLGLNNKPDKRTIYYHFTVATNTENVEFVFASVKDIIIQRALNKAALL